jgi:NADP-dependent 3-hydroxy acid dehydrogenase YdfG
MELKNKIVWITGASSGIGEALCYQLNKMGARLIISSRNREALYHVKNNCKINQNCLIFQTIKQHLYGISR